MQEKCLYDRSKTLRIAQNWDLLKNGVKSLLPEKVFQSSDRPCFETEN